VAAGNRHALALTEGGELYGWGFGGANGHGHEARTPQLVAALIGVRVKLASAQHDSSCAVTEIGELFTWGGNGLYNLGHGTDTPHVTPKRVVGQTGVRVAAVALGWTNMLAADENGVVWGLGSRCVLGLDDEPADVDEVVEHPTPIPALRVRVRKSPPVVRLRR